MKYTIFLVYFTSFSCSTVTKSNLATKADYAASIYYMSQGDAKSARKLLPQKESDGFIRTVEETWLDFLAGDPKPDKLQKICDQLESKKTFFIRKEAESFFYKESADTYFPAEHEVIAAHLVLGFAYLKKGDIAAAKVEAKKAAFYLQSNFKEGENFDSSGLRLWLATLWTACGEWNSARVDLSVAAKLTPHLEWASRLAKSKTPPKNLILIFSGPGPDLTWDPSKAKFEGGLSFKPANSQSKFEMGGQAITSGVSSSLWYSRHIHRNFLIKDVMTDSRYMAESMLPLGAAGTVRLAGIGLGITVGTVGVVSGTAVALYGLKLMIEAGITELVPLAIPVLGGLVIGSYSISAASSIMENSKSSANNIIDEYVSPVNRYRYVRFLPNWIYAGAIEKDLKDYSLTQFKDSRSYEPIINLNQAGSNGRVVVFFVPGNQYERAHNSKNQIWKNPANDDEWVVLYGLQNASDASKGCQNLGTEIGYTSWSLPKWEQFQIAKKQGIKDNSVAPLFADALMVDDIWSFNLPGGLNSECHTIDLRDNTEGQVKDCEKPRRALCVRSRH